MKPNFALSLSFDGIGLLQRVEGGWHLIGTAALDDADLPARLADLRAIAQSRAPEGLTTKLIIPNEQIKYLRAPVFGETQTEQMEQVRLRLEGATPYPVEDLLFDWRMDGPIAQIAAVARETVDEAEAFARDHEFNPVSFVAEPAPKEFAGEPFFGTAQGAADLVAEGDKVEPDRDALIRVAAEDLLPPPMRVKAPAAPAEPGPVAPDEVGFVTRRRAEDVPRVRPPAPPVEGGDAATRLTLMPDPPARAADDPPSADEVPAPAPAEAARSRRPRAAPVGRKPPPVTAPRVPPAPEPAGAGFAEPAAPPPSPVAAPAPPSPDTSAEDRAPGPPPPQGFLDRVLKSDPETERRRHAQRIEAEKLTVFGARKKIADSSTPEIGGKPRHLGLILTGALVVVLFLVALVVGTPDRATVERLIGGGTDIAAQAPAPAASSTPASTPALPRDPATPTATLRDAAPSAEELAEAADPAVSVVPAERPVEALVVPIALPTRLSPEEAALRYAATGIWQRAPDPVAPSGETGLNALYMASIDPVIAFSDAVALPSERRIAPDDPIRAPGIPPGPETVLRVEPDGSVLPTPEGALTPEGITVFSGQPAIVPPRRPGTAAVLPDESPSESDEAIAEAPAEEPRLRPLIRPAGLVERYERAVFGGRTRAELAGLRPRLRPQDLAPPAAPAPAPEPATALGSTVPLGGSVPAGIDAAVAQALTGTAQAITRSPTPRLRPRDFGQIVDRSRSQPRDEVQVAAAVAPRTVTPSGRTVGTVSRNATIDNAINLRRVNLIGVYGKPSSRRALVRLANGRYVKVGIGDRVDGGRVAAIGESELRYVKRGRNITLTMPRG